MKVNGERRSRTVPARFLLSDVLRKELGIRSVRRGCETGKCGACTVLLDGEPAKSCNVLAGQANGKSVETIDTMSESEVGSIVVDAFKRNHALQCGFCTSGFLLATEGLLRETPDPDRDEIREGLQGNICRCTGYTRIIQAVEDAAGQYTPEGTIDG